MAHHEKEFVHEIVRRWWPPSFTSQPSFSKSGWKAVLGIDIQGRNFVRRICWNLRVIVRNLSISNGLNDQKEYSQASNHYKQSPNYANPPVRGQFRQHKIQSFPLKIPSLCSTIKTYPPLA